MLDSLTKSTYEAILKYELRPAMGCTEPIAIAYASSILGELISGCPERINAKFTGNIIKNVKSVIVPMTGGRHGIEAAIAAGLISGIEKAPALMSKRFPNLIKQFPTLDIYYRDLPEDEKSIMEIALFPEVFMRANFYNTYVSDLAEAEKEGDPQKIFKARVKKEVLDEILNMWRDFRVQNELFVFAFDEKEE
jgi:hypothetical protein